MKFYGHEHNAIHCIYLWSSLQKHILVIICSLFVTTVSSILLTGSGRWLIFSSLSHIINSINNLMFGIYTSPKGFVFYCHQQAQRVFVFYCHQQKCEEYMYLQTSSHWFKCMLCEIGLFYTELQPVDPYFNSQLKCQVYNLCNTYAGACLYSSSS